MTRVALATYGPGGRVARGILEPNMPYDSLRIDENGQAANIRALLASARPSVRRSLATTCLWSRTSYVPCWGGDLPSPACILANSKLQELTDVADNELIQFTNSREDHELRIASFVRAQRRGVFIEPLVIGPDGWLWDGMHRLAALYACDVPEVDVLDFSDGRSCLIRPPISLNDVIGPRWRQPEASDVLREEFARAQPYRHIFISEVFDAAFAETITSELEGLEWTLSTTEFYAQYEISLIDTEQPFDNPGLDSLREVSLSRAFAKFISTVTGQGRLDVVDVACHKSTTGQQIGIHNDFDPEGDVCRFTIHLNSCWTLNDGGLFITYASEDCGAMTASYLPAMNSALLFEISPNSFHAVTEVTGVRPRYSIVISFRQRNGTQ